MAYGQIDSVTLYSLPSAEKLDTEALDIKKKAEQQLDALVEKVIKPLREAFKKKADDAQSSVTIPLDGLVLSVTRIPGKDNPSYKGIFEEFLAYWQFSTSNTVEGIAKRGEEYLWNAQHLHKLLLAAYDHNNSPKPTYRIP